jgi:hypothetical protein
VCVKLQIKQQKKTKKKKRKKKKKKKSRRVRIQPRGGVAIISLFPLRVCRYETKTQILTPSFPPCV